MPQSRLKPYHFVSEDRHGRREERTFYAASLRLATDYALRWGRRMRYKMYRRKGHRGI